LGLSGPLALDISLFWEKGVVEFDFWPSGCLEKILESKSKKQISSLISLPKRFIKAFLEAEKIEDKTINLLTKEEKNSLKKLHKYIFAPAGTLGLAKAEVVKGGVDTKEVDSLTLESRCQKNLYFIGEVLNVTGALGGYNLHWAFASARQCTKHLT
ncbi:MAG: aminoacetone oxidase family FAD-binding enzyme, partial [Campylobacteraceae bacterium]|nr:aminoacetone oxidase family FAD-binding enzyme [Campylobacteraceae bacterium]